ncbi:PEP/pyruvate-binding domain-containing protein [Candidatus Latescibacterota bacterium]
MLGPRPLHAIVDDDQTRYGGKASNLARMMRWGLPVPDGYAVAFSPNESMQLGDAEESAILQAYQDLGEGAVAVRSSAIGEDGDDASFAGQYRTALKVAGAAAVLDAVRLCAASALSQRVQTYRDHLGVAAGGMGVIVQRMVPAEYAGVCFTRAPGSEQQIAVEAVRGLGEDLVSGRRRPARATLSRNDLAVSGTDDHEGVLATMGETAIRAVARLALDAERRFGHALDLEWAWVDGQCFLVQARPLTAGHVSSEREQIRRAEIGRLRSLAGGRLALWTDSLAADMLASSAPLTMDLFPHCATYEGGIGRAFRELGFRYTRSDSARHALDSICGRPMVNVGEMMRALTADMPLTVDAKAASATGAALDPASPPLTVDWRRWWLLAWFPVAGLRWLLVVPRRFFAMRRRLHREFTERLGPALREEAARLRSRDLSDLSRAELWDAFRSYWERITGQLIRHHQLADIVAMGTHGLLQSSLRMLYGDGADEVESRLTTGIDGNYNTECNLALARVARGQLSLDEFLDEYGQRGNPDWDLAAPRWREDPSRVKRMVAKIAASPVDALARFEEQRGRRRDAEEQFSADMKRHWWMRFWRKRIMADLAFLQRYSPLREATQGVLYLWVELARRVVLEAAGRLEAGELLFYLTYDELRRLLCAESRDELLEGARARRRRLQVARSIYVPHVVRSDDLEAIGRPPAPLDHSVHELCGLVVSSGVARGPARVVTGLHEAEDLQPGDILVAAHTDPAWTPLFFVAGGLVLEQGGILSHGAIVAREVGLPAVVNVPDATRLIESGQEVVVDGTRGRVAFGGHTVQADGSE